MVEASQIYRLTVPGKSGVHRETLPLRKKNEMENEEEEVVKPISLLLTPSMIEHNGQAAVRLYATLGFETGLHGEKVELGILRSFDPSATLTLENVGNGVEQRTTGNATDVTFANSFYASEVTSGTVYAVAYLKYIDTNGENQVLYTSVVEFSVES